MSGKHRHNRRPPQQQHYQQKQHSPRRSKPAQRRKRFSSNYYPWSQWLDGLVDEDQIYPFSQERGQHIGNKSAFNTIAGGPATTRAKKKSTKTTGDEAASAVGNPDPPDISADLGVPLGFKGARPRQTLPINANVLGALPYAFLPRRQYEAVDLTTLPAGSFGVQQLIDLLVDAHDEVGQALWNWLRLANPGWKYEVRTPDNTKEDPEGKAELDIIIGRLNQDYGGLNALINQFLMSAALQGAACGECVPTADIDDVDDIVSVTPWTIYFQRDLDQKYVPYQWQPMLAASGAGWNTNGYNTSPLLPDQLAKPPSTTELITMQALNHGGFRRLNTTTFGYVPLDPALDDPYGRMPFAPMVQLIVFDAQILKDLRQWSHVHAWGRVDVSVVADMAIKMMPPTTQNNIEQRAAWLNKYLGDVISAYNGTNPDDTYVHWDNVKVAASEAGTGTFQIDNLMRLLERRVFRALKQLPLLMGSNEGTTESWGSIQMEVYANGIQSIQNVAKALLEKLLNVALRLRGRTSVVQFEFEKVRATDRIKDAQAEAIEIKNAANKRDQGWITQDEAAIQITGSKAVAPGPNPDPVVAPLQPDSGSDANRDDFDDGTPEKPQQERPKDDEKPGDDASETGETGEPAEPAPSDNPDAPPKEPSEPEPPDGKEGTDAEEPSKPAKSQKSTSKRAIAGLAATERMAIVRAMTGLTVAALRTTSTSSGSDAADEATAAPQHTGVMLACFLDSDTAEQLALEDGEPADELHVTLAYLGDLEEDNLDADALREQLVPLMQSIAERTEPLTGQIAGIGRFTSAPDEVKTPVYASVDVPGLSAFREELVAAIREAGVSVNDAHGFTPHVTLAYIDADAEMPIENVPALDLVLDRVTLAIGGEHVTAFLGSGEQPDPDRHQRVVISRASASGNDGDDQEVDPDNPQNVGGLGGESAPVETSGGYRAPSQKRLALIDHYKREVAGVFRQTDVPESIYKTFVEQHRDRSYAESLPKSQVVLQRAINVCGVNHDLRARLDAGEKVVFQRLTKAQRAALIAALALLLLDVFPDENEDLATIIVEGRLASWDAAGSEALDRLGITGEFKLTNAQVINTVESLGTSDTSGIQNTSRQAVASTIADDLAAGASLDEITADVRGVLASWEDNRAQTISQWTVDSAWGDAEVMTYQRNGYLFKVWRTSGDPDPGAKRSAPCRENAYAGAIPIDQSFPSGDDAPPAHNGCVCCCDPAGDPAEDAAASPWLGDD